MGELIKIQREELKPTIRCPHCKNEILVDIRPFAHDVSKILSDKCVKCGGTIFVGVLILSNPKLQGLLGAISAVINAIGQHNTILKG